LPACRRPLGHIYPCPKLDLTDDEHTAVAALARHTMLRAGSFSDRIRTLRSAGEAGTRSF
jgi:hypothetical protein